MELRFSQTKENIMEFSLAAYMISVGAVILAELGDKTQLLTIAFATKYKLSQVLAGIFIAVIVSHGMAVLLGSFLGALEGAKGFIQAAASLSFIVFGFLTITGGDGEEESKRKDLKLGAVITVAFAFFIAEMGDKTQLAAMALSARFPASGLFVLLGTTTGMIISNIFAITCGVILCRRIPERTLKIVSAIAFVMFGVIGIGQFLDAYTKLDLVAAVIVSSLIFAGCIFGIMTYIKKNGITVSENPASEYCKIKNAEK